MSAEFIALENLELVKPLPLLNDQYYNVGFLSPYILNGMNKPPKPVCNENTSCRTKDFSMCYFPVSNYGARLYFGTEWRKPCNSCDRYLHKV